MSRALPALPFAVCSWRDKYKPRIRKQSKRHFCLSFFFVGDKKLLQRGARIPCRETQTKKKSKMFCGKYSFLYIVVNFACSPDNTYKLKIFIRDIFSYRQNGRSNVCVEKLVYRSCCKFFSRVKAQKCFYAPTIRSDFLSHSYENVRPKRRNNSRFI